MSLYSRRKQLALAVAMTVGLSAPVLAQQTSSAIRGNVTTAEGQVIPDARITVTDTRTGSQKVLTANSAGAFSLRGLQVGGPYHIQVSHSRGSRTLEDVYLSLGETANINLS